MISIIIPIYNAGKYLTQCLESIRMQTYRDFEVLLIDDGSTDNSAEICKSIANSDNRFHYHNKKNGGVSRARNYGLLHAKGQWICFVDADDWITHNYLQALTSQKPEADITFFGVYTVNPDGSQATLTPTPVYTEKREHIEEAIFTLRCGDLGDILGWTWDKMFRAEIIRKNNIRFPENISFREDEIFTLEYCRYITSLRIIAQPLYYYRKTNDGLTSKGLQPSELLPSSIHLEESLKYYSHPELKEHILKSATDYRALNIYANPFRQIKQNLDEFQKFISRNPQSGLHFKMNHLTQYLHKSYWLAYFYCLIRKI